jgi:chemotaxis protein methyltransferase CheR
MGDRDVIDYLLRQLLGARLGHIPAYWPSRLYDVLERMARDSKQPPAVVVQRLLETDESPAIDALIDASTIGHTSFFRHPEQFEYLRKELLRLAASSVTPVRIWCAACSTGEEAYSVAICGERAGVTVEVLGTDVSPAAIKAARAGAYSETRPRRLPDDPEATDWTAPHRLRKVVRFEVASLVSADPACESGPFDVIFCRNALIYFERAEVPEILRSLSEHLRPGGALVLSPADAVLPLADCLRRGDAPGWLYVFDAASPSLPKIPPRVSSSRSARSLSVRPPDPGRPRPAADGAAPPIDEPPLERAARLLGSGQGGEAESILMSMLDTDSDHIAAWFLLGEALLLRGESTQARTAFTRACRCNPKDAAGVDGNALKWAATRRALALDC